MGELVLEVKETDLPISSIKDRDTTVSRHFDDNKVAQLMESIRQIGLLHAITVSEDMYLIAGRHRKAACERLGKKTIAAKVLPLRGVIAELASIDENLLHAPLTQLEESEHIRRREEILAELGLRATRGCNGGENAKKGHAENRASASDDGLAESDLDDELDGSTKLKLKTTADIASEMGMGKRTAQEYLQIANNITKEARDAIRDTDISDNKSELIRLAKVTDPIEQLKIAKMVADGTFRTVKEAVSEAQKNKQREDYDKLSAETKKLPDTIKLFNEDFFIYEEKIKDDSIDMILTDPPYIEAWSEYWVPFLGVANRILKPGGALITYIGHVRLPELFEALRCGELEFGETALKFYWICALEHKGSIAAVHSTGAMTGFKPVVIIMKPPTHKPYNMYNDLIVGGGRSKDTHDWQQESGELLPLVDAFSKPGDTILDPFMGSGSTGILSKMTARKFIGVELEKKTYNDARRRISLAEV